MGRAALLRLGQVLGRLLHMAAHADHALVRHFLEDQPIDEAQVGHRPGGQDFVDLVVVAAEGTDRLTLGRDHWRRGKGLVALLALRLHAIQVVGQLAIRRGQLPVGGDAKLPRVDAQLLEVRVLDRRHELVLVARGAWPRGRSPGPSGLR